ncbi:MAG: metallophosphoesterase [Chloroflexi bacterium]|nr:metallophosphoesterase [Chloroflexota bacterium]
MGNSYFIGDVHGHLDKLIALLRNVQLVDEKLRWIGQEATLCFMGDFVDRGPDGIGVIDFVMGLQREAADAGGRVLAVMGNHDLILVAVRFFPQALLAYDGSTFLTNWRRNGGITSDLERLNSSHVEWLLELPAMLKLGKLLVVHADAWFYTRYGRTIDEVNYVFRQLFEDKDTDGLDRLLEDFAERFTFRDFTKATEFMQRYGDTRTRQIIHGHTPITKLSGQPSEKITTPYVYAEGLCINIDGGMYLGSPGFVYRPE